MAAVAQRLIFHLLTATSVYLAAILNPGHHFAGLNEKQQVKKEVLNFREYLS